MVLKLIEGCLQGTATTPATGSSRLCAPRNVNDDVTSGRSVGSEDDLRLYFQVVASDLGSRRR